MILCHGRDPSLRKEAEYEGAPVVWWFECSVCGRTSDKGHHADLAEQSWNDGWEAERTHFVELPAPTPPVFVSAPGMESKDVLTFEVWEKTVRTLMGRDSFASLMEQRPLPILHPYAHDYLLNRSPFFGPPHFFPSASVQGSGYAFDRQQEESLLLHSLRAHAAMSGNWSGYNATKNQLMQRAREAEKARSGKEWRRLSGIRPVTDPATELSVLIKTDYETQMWEKATASFVHSRYAEPAIVPMRGAMTGAALEQELRKTEMQMREVIARRAAEQERERWEIQFKREHPNHLYEGRFPDHSDVADAMAYATQTLVAKRAREVAEAHKAVQESIYARDAVELLEKRKHLLVKELQDLEYRVHDKKQEMLQLKAACDAFEVLGPHRLPYPVEGSTISLSSTGCIAYMNGWEVGRCQSTYVIEEVPNKPGVFEMRPDYGYGGSPEEDDATSYHIYDYNTGTDDDD